MPDRCVVYGCSNESNFNKGISLHRIPFNNDDRPEAKKRRKKWIDFVSKKRAKWQSTKHSAVCSDHFLLDDFQRYIVEMPNSKEAAPRLKKDYLGIAVFPSIHEVMKAKPATARSQRQAAKELERVKRGERSVLSIIQQATDEQPTDEQPTDEQSQLYTDQGSDQDSIAMGTDSEEATEIHIEASDINLATCLDCTKLKKRNKQLRNNWMTAKFKLRQSRLQLKSKKTDCCCNKENEPKTSKVVEKENIIEEDNYCTDNDDEYGNESDYTVTEEEPEDDDSYVGEEDTATDTDTDDERDSRVYIKDDNIRTQPKFIVFLSHLLMLFKFCHFCKNSNPLVEVRQVGTMAEVTSNCTNPKCRKEFIWKSQPLMPSTKIPAGNLLLCFSILVAGGSASKVFQIFKHMGLACISLNTFFKHQRKLLFPSILMHWKRYQQKMMEKLRSAGSGIAIAGDGRHDSMGHSAKYCSYTIFGCDVSQIIHFGIVQRNESGSSPAMEYMAFDRCMRYLLGSGLAISTFISDRHTSIVKHMREQLTNIVHYFDLWHLKKTITKTLTKLSKERGCEEISHWIKPCGNHLYWSACSTHNGNGQVIWAKFRSFLSHIINKHDNLQDPIFNRCHHGPDIPSRQWLLEDSSVYDKLCKSLTKPRLVSAIKQASPMSQTSCLEGFHSVLNQFAPKMINYSFPGMYCRHILAVLYFNSNLNRDVKVRIDGSQQVKVIFPKFKNGEGTVRDIRIKPNLDYVEEIFQTMVLALEANDLNDAIQELKDMTPAPMNSMLEKQPKEDALQKREQRRGMSTRDVPPTTPVTDALGMDSEQNIEAAQRTKAKPHCSICKNPMKGHKKITDCPRNRSPPQND